MENPHDTDRIIEKLWEALYCLVGAGTMKQRIHDVWLSTMPIMEHQVPAIILDDFVFLKLQLTKHLDNLSDDEAAELGRKILDMYTTLKGGI